MTPLQLSFIIAISRVSFLISSSVYKLQHLSYIPHYKHITTPNDNFRPNQLILPTTNSYKLYFSLLHIVMWCCVLEKMNLTNNSCVQLPLTLQDQYIQTTFYKKRGKLKLPFKRNMKVIKFKSHTLNKISHWPLQLTEVVYSQLKLKRHFPYSSYNQCMVHAPSSSQVDELRHFQLNILTLVK